MRNQFGLSLILISFSILAYSVYPLFAVLAIEEINPIAFVAISHSAAMVAVIFVLLASKQNAGFVKLDLLLHSLRDRENVINFSKGGITNGISHASFFASFYFLEPAIATILYEIWPVIGMYLIYFMIRGSYERVTISDGLYAALAFLGYTVVVLSDSVIYGEQISLDVSPNEIIGVALAGLSSITMAYSSAMGIKVNKYYESKGAGPLLASTYVQIVTKIWSGLVPLLVWLTSRFFLPSDNVSFDQLVGPITAGVFIVAFGASTYIASMSMSSRSNITILYYLTPVLSLIWISLMGYDTITMGIIFGSTLIILSNLLISVRADPSASYTSTLLALLFASVYIYYVPGLADPSFYDALAVPAGVFAILVAFLLNRMHSREQEQEETAVSILIQAEKSEEFREGMTLEEVSEVVTNVWTDPKGADAIVFGSEATRSKVGPELRLSLFRLALKRISPVSYAERLVLIVIGLTVVFVSLVFRSADIQGDVIALSLTVSTVFLCALILDNSRLTPGQILDTFRMFSQGRKRTTITVLNSVASIILMFIFLAIFAAAMIEKYKLINF